MALPFWCPTHALRVKVEATPRPTGLKESNDVHRWFEWLAMQQHPNCVFGMGESMGAAILLQSLEKENRFCAVVAEPSFASFRQIAYVRVGQFFHRGAWLGRVVLRPAVELAFLYGRATPGINLADASPERSVVGSRVPILLIHGLADDNIPPQQSERIREHNPAEIVLLGGIECWSLRCREC
jgi:dipeptidyl aminopeptidase/acylaminoacyl peptidase